MTAAATPNSAAANAAPLDAAPSGGVVDADVGLGELASQYELLGELGRGGSAVVYRARDRRLLREVALKVVRLAPALSERERASEVARLGREARTIARLEHPNIVTVHAVHELRDGLAVSMRYVPGRTLKQLVADEGALGAERAVRAVRDVAAALAYAHAHGVVHRDVKPENIFIDDASGRALLADFGAARADDFDVRVTRTGATIGTPAYMSPEQIDGGPVDGRSDLYSLGLVAWEALTGRRPWETAGLYQLLHHQKHDALPPIGAVRPPTAPPVPLAVEYVVARLLEKRPGARWATADAVGAQLEHPVLPADFKLWERTHRRRLAEFAKTGGITAVSRGGAVSAVARTEQLRPGTATAATAAIPAAAAAPSDPTVPAGDLPSWANARRGRPRWYAGGIAAALLAVALPLTVWTWNAGPAADPDAPRPGWDGPLSVAVPAGAPARVGGADALTASPAVAPSPPASNVVAGEVMPGASELPSAPAATSAPAERDSARESAAPQARDTDAAARVVVIAAGVPAPLPAATARSAARPRSDVATRPAASTAPAPAAPRPAAPTPAPPTPVAPAPTVASGSAGAGASPGPRAAVVVERALLAAGARHTCALDAAGRALCWGANENGQLGAGDLTSRGVPTSVAGELRFAQLATGGAHSCGVTADGDAYCWGDDDHGQLGDATTTMRDAPVRVAGAWSYRALRAGLDHTCALTTGGAVVCWGGNGRGQLGDGSTRNRSTPAAVAGVRAAAITAGWRHSCVLTPDGAALCWGDNAGGQLGDGTRTTRATPVVVAGGRQFVAIAAGASHTCAAATDGGTYCWGTGGAGAGPHLSPVRVDASVPFVALAAGGVHTCGRTASGQLFCWGRNPYGQLGDGTTGDRWRAVRVPGGPFTAVSAAGAHTCAMAGGSPVCWGYNVSGQLGDGTRAHHATPTRVARATQ